MAVKEARFFQGIGPVADNELELHYRLCGGVIVVTAQDQLKWAERIGDPSAVHTPFTLRALRGLPKLILIGTLSVPQLTVLYERARREKIKISVIDARPKLTQLFDL